MAESPTVAQLADRLRPSLEAAREGHLVVLTGAGVSHASGIPTFRGEDEHAIWKRDVTELGTFAYFREDPAGSWSWYLHRFASLDAVPASTARSEAMSRDLKKRGMTFVGPTICYAFMQATGMVNDHVTDCFRWKPLSRSRP